MFGVGVLVILVIVAIFAPLIAPHDPYKNDMAKSLQSPSGEHCWGPTASVATPSAAWCTGPERR